MENKCEKFAAICDALESHWTAKLQKCCLSNIYRIHIPHFAGKLQPDMQMAKQCSQRQRSSAFLQFRQLLIRIEILTVIQVRHVYITSSLIPPENKLCVVLLHEFSRTICFSSIWSDKWAKCARFCCQWHVCRKLCKTLITNVFDVRKFVKSILPQQNTRLTACVAFRPPEFVLKIWTLDSNGIILWRSYINDYLFDGKCLYCIAIINQHR